MPPAAHQPREQSEFKEQRANHEPRTGVDERRGVRRSRCARGSVSSTGQYLSQTSSRPEPDCGLHCAGPRERQSRQVPGNHLRRRHGQVGTGDTFAGRALGGSRTHDESGRDFEPVSMNRRGRSRRKSALGRRHPRNAARRGAPDARAGSTPGSLVRPRPWGLRRYAPRPQYRRATHPPRRRLSLCFHRGSLPSPSTCPMGSRCPRRCGQRAGRAVSLPAVIDGTRTGVKSEALPSGGRREPPELAGRICGPESRR